MDNECSLDKDAASTIEAFKDDGKTKLIFQHFCNCLYLGQWEVAKACVKRLHIVCQDSKGSVSAILRDVIKNPFNRSLPSQSVASPCQLSWLCLLEAEKLCHGVQGQTGDISVDKKMVEFHLLLVDVCQYITDTHLKEVYLYYRWIHASLSVNHPLTLSSGLLKVLQTLLLQQPLLGHTLIKSLIDQSNTQLSKNNKSLQLVYENCINTLVDSFSQEDLDGDIKSEKSEKLYEILAYFDFNLSKTQLPVRQMFSKLIDHCQLGSKYVSKTSIVSVLVGHKDLYLLEEFCRIDYETETNKAVSTYQACAELSEEQRWILHLSSLCDIHTRWKMFLMFSMKRKKHILELILETGLVLIKCSMFSELKQMLEPEELWPLRPLLLLLGWTHCYSSSEARQLLDTLWNNTSKCEHPAITVGCNKLAYQIDLIQWCLEKAKPLLNVESGGSQFQRATDLFKGLESHSVLYVLQTSTKLSSLDQQEVLELLQKVPLQGQKESDDSEKKKTKTVRFQEETDNQSVIPVASLDQKKDMAIFTGYCVLKNIMDSVLFCAECSDKRLTDPIRRSSRHRLTTGLVSDSASSIESMCLTKSSSANVCDNSTSVNTEGVNQDEKRAADVKSLYRDKVTGRLKQAKMYLSKLQPLTFRVEILENVFSLLFLTHEDVQETMLLSEYDSDEIDDRQSSMVGSVGLMTPVLSPVKANRKVPEVVVDSASSSQTNMDYDVPFQDSELEDTGTAVDMQKVEEALEMMKSDIAEKSKKMRQESNFDGRHSSVSENISSISTSSSLNLDSIGFIANNYIVRDILAMLKDCILDVSAAKYQMYGNKADARERYRSSREATAAKCLDIDVTSEEALCRLVRSNVTMETLQKRITQLERYTSEAHWRYQLVSDDHIPSAPGEVLPEVVMTTGDHSDDEVEIRGYRSDQGNKKRKRTVSGRKSPQSGSEMRQSFTDLRSKDRNVSSRCTSNVVLVRRPGHIKSPKLVSMMLSSPITLLAMSVRKGQFTQTKQIIKLFKLEDTSEAVEVYFSQAYQKACRSIQSITGKDLPSSGAGSGVVGLKAVASAAAAGLATASVTDVADDILNFPTIPKIPKIDISENLPQNIAQLFQQENIPVMILLDLICTSGKSWAVCNHLLDTIKAHKATTQVPNTEDASVQSLEPKSSVSISRQRVKKMRTFSDMTTQIECLLQLGAEDQIPCKEQTTLAKTFQKSIQYFLSHATHSLTAEKSRQFESLNQNLSKLTKNVEEAYMEYSKGQGHATPRSEVRQRLGSTSSQSSKLKQEKPSIHHCMKVLLHALEKDIPLGGAIALISRNSRSRHDRNRNYLLSLYEHCKELAYLVAESESQSKENVIPSNYFHILEEGPLRVLGRMMFKKKMAPAKLEKVAAKLSLNLTHIIVYSCCVKIPSKPLPLLNITTGKDCFETICCDGRVRHNVSKVTETVSVGNAEEFVRGLLQRLLHLMKEIAGSCNAQGLFDTTCASLLTKSTDFYDIIKQTSLLQSADPLQLDRNEKKCFYGNLLTLMTIHCHVHHLWRIEMQQAASKEPVKRDVIKTYSQMTATEQITFLSMFSYKVGLLGDISIFDLRYQLTRCGLFAPSEWGRILEQRIQPMDDCDPWCQLAPDVDPQLLFTLTSCCASSPPVQVLNPAQLADQLHSSMNNYLQTCVQVDKVSKQVKIPELLLWYRRDFISGQSIREIAEETDGLLAFIVSHLSGEKETCLRAILKEAEHSPKKDADQGRTDEQQVDIGVIHHNKEFKCVFDFDSLGYVQNSISNGELKSMTGETTLSDADITYKLTPNTLEYIKSDCPLVATLVSLTCSDDMEENLIDDAFEESHFTTSGSMSSFESSQQSLFQNSMNRSRTSSSMSSLDLKSYRYEKLSNDYPALKRHMLNYIVPLAATEDPDILKGDDPILKLLTHDIVEKFKANILSMHESSGFKTLLTGLLNELFTLKKWKEVLQVIDCVPVTVVRKETSLCNLHDFVVCCLIHKQCSVGKDNDKLNKNKSEEIMLLLNRILSADGQAHEILSVYHKLQIEHNIDLFRLCLGRTNLNSVLKEALQRKAKQLEIFHKITECAKSLQFKLSLQSTGFVSEEDKIYAKKRHDILDKFTVWQTVVEWTKTSPREVLALLIKAGDFKTAKTWSMLEKLDDDIKQEIEEHHIIALLNMEPSNTTEAFMVLEVLRKQDQDLCVSMCRKFLDVFNRQQDVLFIASYILNQLGSHVGEKQLTDVRLIHIGARMILCLPESMHIEYCHLVSTPRFILEQLLMNMKPELASKAFQTVQEEFLSIRDPKHIFNKEQFNTLVAFYAKKALEFTVIQYLDGDKDRSFSVRSMSSDNLDARDSPQFRHSPQPRHDFSHLKRRSVDLQGSTRLAASAPHTSGSPVTRATSVAKETVFVMPSEPPPRDKWVPDSEASVCMVCKVEQFSMFNRRHHCRRCGRVVCAACSENVTPIKGVNARTCNDCYREIVKSGDVERRTSAAEIYHHHRLSDSSMTTSPTVAVHSTVISVIQEAATSQSLTDVINHSHTAWKLQTDNDYNAYLREDFYFEQAPSTSLCISILNLHGNNRECGQLILTMCDDLSKFLKPLAPGVPNPEVDYNLVMSMMKYLLFHAKIKFTKCGDNSGMGRCDVYQGLVDLLALLVIDNFRDLPSIEELTKVDSVRRLRDKLIGDERLSLAMEVSTKCGLDPTGVWVAWGMMCLQSGDFATAREKFSKCLKPVKDKNVCTPLPKVLNDVIDCLESMPGTGAMEIQVLLTNPGSVKNLINTPSSTFYEEVSMDSQQFQECLYYLRTFGTYFSLVDFHRRHGYYMKAVQYILDHRCSVEVFVEGLLSQSVHNGEMGRLTDQMLLIDPSLEKWNPYLTASCRYFVKHKLHHVLYEFQLFMKDFIRAGMTCFTYFYQEGARSYLDLARRINHLFIAQQHMQAYLDPAHWGNVQHPLSVPQRQGSWEEKGLTGEHVSVRLVKSTEDVTRYIKTIALQIEVTKYFQACLTSQGGEVAAAAMSTVGSSKVPTLFGSQQVRNDLTIMILMCGNNIESSFALAARIIKEYKLGGVGIYTHVAREMAKAGNYDNMRSLLRCVEKLEIATDDVMDEILGACLLVLADNASEAKEAENIIKLLRKDANKINAYILCGKLRSAYLMAVKENRVDDVKRILRAAKSMGQSAVVNICNKWLENQK